MPSLHWTKRHLTLLDIPHFTETYKEKGKSGFWNIFGGDSQKREERKAERQERKQEKRDAAELQPDAKKEQPAKEEPKSNIWNKIRDALKKK